MKRLRTDVIHPDAPAAPKNYVQLNELTKLSERQLQAEIIEPLLGALGFRNVHDTSGPIEHGKDLVATLDELGYQNLWAIQIKKFNASAKVASSSSFGALLDQLKQAIQEPVVDPATGLRRPPDRCLFITPFPISPTVRDAFHQRLDEPVFAVLRIWDGQNLCDLIRDRMPQVVLRFSMEAQYRLDISRYTNTIYESGVAFDRKEIELSSIYVDLSLGHGSNLLHGLIMLRGLRVPDDSAPKKRKDRFAVTCTRKEALDFKPTFKRWAATELLDDHNEPVSRHSRKKLKINLRPFLLAAQDRLRAALVAFGNIPSKETTDEDCHQIAANAIKLEHELEMLRHDDFFQRYCLHLLKDHTEPDKSMQEVCIPSSSLMKLRSRLFVTGPPERAKQLFSVVSHILQRKRRRHSRSSCH
jgi:hypothetical protein